MSDTKEYKLSLAEKVATGVEIMAVRLVDSHIHRPDDMPKLPRRVRVGYGADTRIDRAGSKLWVRVNCQLASGEDDQSDPLIEVLAVFMLVYDLPNIADYTDEELNAFGETNGVYNAWPFWREYVYSALARMALPPITIPVFRYDDAIEDVETVK